MKETLFMAKLDMNFWKDNVKFIWSKANFIVARFPVTHFAGCKDLLCNHLARYFI